MTRVIALVFAVAVLGGGASTSAQSGLADEIDINEGLVVIAAADKIRRECSGIKGRLFRAIKEANRLKETARARGYSDDEIDAFLNNKEEKARVREARNLYFESKGASTLDAQSLCVLGSDEIARNSQIGHLLKEK